MTKARIRTPGGNNDIALCRYCRREGVELLRVEDFGRMCSPCLIKLATVDDTDRELTTLPNALTQRCKGCQCPMAPADVPTTGGHYTRCLECRRLYPDLRAQLRAIKRGDYVA